MTTNTGTDPQVEVRPGNFGTRVPAELLRDVQTVLAGATEQLTRAGWRRNAPERGRAGGARIIDAINYSSAHASIGDNAHRMAITCVAMAVELHTSTPAHELLPGPLADAYLDARTGDAYLHRLDVSIVVRYNLARCTGAGDAAALLRLAFEQAEPVIAAQQEHRPITGFDLCDECLSAGECVMQDER